MSLLRLKLLTYLLVLASACEAAPPAGSETGGDDLAAMKEEIRAAAWTAYAEDCGTIHLAENVFVPIEVTGDDIPELAVFLFQSDCATGANLFYGTGGGVVQIWANLEGGAHQLMELQAHGFTPTGDGLVSIEHAGSCPDSIGPDGCIVTYRWNPASRTLDVLNRELVSKAHNVPTPRYPNP